MTQCEKVLEYMEQMSSLMYLVLGELGLDRLVYNKISPNGVTKGD